MILKNKLFLTASLCFLGLGVEGFCAGAFFRTKAGEQRRISIEPGSSLAEIKERVREAFGYHSDFRLFALGELVRDTNESISKIFASAGTVVYVIPNTAAKDGEE